MAGDWDVWKRRRGMQSLSPINLSQTASSNLKAEESKYWGNRYAEPCNNKAIRMPTVCLLFASSLEQQFSKSGSGTSSISSTWNLDRMRTIGHENQTSVSTSPQGISDASSRLWTPGPDCRWRGHWLCESQWWSPLCRNVTVLFTPIVPC